MSSPVLTWAAKPDLNKVKDPASAAARSASLRHIEALDYGVLAGDDNASSNMLIYGNNLLALRALLPDYAGLVKCVYIDPPYNSGSSLEYYNNKSPHEAWLSMMAERLCVLRELLARDGSLWISIGEDEAHYLKVLCDEILGRQNFIIQTTILRSAPTGHKAINPTPVQVCDFLLAYARQKEHWRYRPVYRERDYDKAYRHFIEHFNEGYEQWTFISLKAAMKKYNFTLERDLHAYADRIIRFAQPNYQGVGRRTRDLIDISKQDERIYLQKREKHPDIYLYKGNRILFYKDKLRQIDGKLVSAEPVTNLWDDMRYQGIAKEGGVVFAKGKKPEAQIKRILEMSTLPGDLVLDSFLGSGTAAAAAHKMGRRWIGIELGEHAYTHCLPRLRAVVDGEQSGISKAAGWKGGGGFRVYQTEE